MEAAGQKRAEEFLFPPIQPFSQMMLDVGDGHQIYVEECGNPRGQPVIVLHGGPGGGCSPMMRRFFDPVKYHIILFDQRGCGKSTPHAGVEANTTWHLVDDIDLIRDRLGLGPAILFGGSWGSTLALIYAQARPDAVRALVLRGIFLGRRQELDWFYGGGAAAFWPDAWGRFCALIPEEERHDLIAAYHRRLFSGDRSEEIRFARAWGRWENATATLHSSGVGMEAPAEYARAFARLENHYFINDLFLTDETAILQNMGKIAHLSAHIVQGRYDMVCPPHSAWSLVQGWDRARLHMIPSAGHAMSEPAIAQKLAQIMREIVI